MLFHNMVLESLHLWIKGTKIKEKMVRGNWYLLSALDLPGNVCVQHIMLGSLHLERRTKPAYGRGVCLSLYSFPGAAVAKHHKLHGLKNQKSVLQFWRLEVQHPVHRTMVSCKGILLLCFRWFAHSLWWSLVCSCITPISAFISTWYSPCVSLSSRGHLLIRTSVISD